MDATAWGIALTAIGVVLSIVAIAITVIHRRNDHRFNPSVHITTILNRVGPQPEISVTIRNDGNVPIRLNNPGHIASLPSGTVLPISPSNVLLNQKGIGAKHFPLTLEGDDELSSIFFQSVVAGELWKMGCKATCRNQGFYNTPKKNRMLLSPKLDVPVNQWLPQSAPVRVQFPCSVSRSTAQQSSVGADIDKKM